MSTQDSHGPFIVGVVHLGFLCKVLEHKDDTFNADNGSKKLGTVYRDSKEILIQSFLHNVLLRKTKSLEV